MAYVRMTSIRAANVRFLIFPQTATNIRYRIFRKAKLEVRGKLIFSRNIEDKFMYSIRIPVGLDPDVFGPIRISE
jgi:hypothetical protein